MSHSADGAAGGAALDAAGAGVGIDTGAADAIGKGATGPSAVAMLQSRSVRTLCGVELARATALQENFDKASADTRNCFDCNDR